VLLNRKEIIEAVTFLIHSAPTESLPEVIEATLPLATDRVQDYDYPDVVNLLCNLAANRQRIVNFLPTADRLVLMSSLATAADADSGGFCRQRIA
jgi:hypothetical protein